MGSKSVRVFGDKNILKGNSTERKTYIFISKNAKMTFFAMMKVLFYVECNNCISIYCEHFNIPIDAKLDEEFESAFTVDPAMFFQKL